MLFGDGTMSIKIEKMVFADLRGTPVLFSEHLSFALRERDRRWVPIANDVAGEAYVLEEAAFFARFGTDLPPLPVVMREFDHRLWHVTEDGELLLAAFRRRRMRGALQSGIHPSTAAQVVRISKSGTEARPATADGHVQMDAHERLPEEAEFYLGGHHYSAGPGCGWTTEYMIRRLDDGDTWELFVTEEEPPGSEQREFAAPEFVSMGQFTTDAIKEYFEGVRFEISETEWDAMGQRRVAAHEEGADAWEADLSENADNYCAVCGRVFDPSPFVMHEC
jgi:hypothetical protein